MRSTAATSTISATSSATCCCRWCSMRAWPGRVRLRRRRPRDQRQDAAPPPHVFDVSVDDADGVMRNWEAIKRAERAANGEQDTPGRHLARPAGVATCGEAAVARGQGRFRLARSAAGAGQGSRGAAGAARGVRARRYRGQQRRGCRKSSATCSSARTWHAMPMSILRGANHKFERRFRAMAQAEECGQRIARAGPGCAGSAVAAGQGGGESVKTLGLFPDRAGRDLPALGMAAQGRLLLPARPAWPCSRGCSCTRPPVGGSMRPTVACTSAPRCSGCGWYRHPPQPLGTCWALRRLAGMAVIMFGPRTIRVAPHACGASLTDGCARGHGSAPLLSAMVHDGDDPGSRSTHVPLRQLPRVLSVLLSASIATRCRAACTSSAAVGVAGCGCNPARASILVLAALVSVTASPGRHFFEKPGDIQHPLYSFMATGDVRRHPARRVLW